MVRCSGAGGSDKQLAGTLSKKLNPARALALLVEWWGDTSASGMSEEPLRRRVILVDLRAKNARGLSKGDGWASATFDASDVLYVEIAGALKVMPQPRSGQFEARIENLSL